MLHDAIEEIAVGDRLVRDCFFRWFELSAASGEFSPPKPRNSRSM